MKYSTPKTTGKSICHQFKSDASEHFIGGKRWNDVSMTFREIKTNAKKRSFGFTIRYRNTENNEYQLNQMTMNEDEIKEFLDVVNGVVNNPPKFKQEYLVGDRFIIPIIKTLTISDSFEKETIYKNVVATINHKYFGMYLIEFDNTTLSVDDEYLDKLERI